MKAISVVYKTVIQSLTIVLLLLSNTIYASKTPKKVTFQYSVYLDKENKTTLHKLPDNLFHDVKNLNLGFWKGAIWTKLRIQTNGNKGSYIIHNNDKINRNYSVYKLSPNKKWVPLYPPIDSLQKNDQRFFNIPKPNFILELDHQDEIVLLLHSTSDGRVVEGTPYISSFEDFSQSIFKYIIINSVFYGIAFIIMLINFFYWPSLKRRVNLIYCAYILSICISYIGMDGFLHNYFTNQLLIDHFTFISIRIWEFTMINFTLAVLKNQERFPKLNKAIKASLFFILGGMTCYQLVFYKTSISNLHVIENLLGYFWIFLVVVVLLINRKKQPEVTKYYFFALASFFLFAIIALLESYTGKIASLLSPITLLKTGTIIELIFFTYMISIFIKKEGENKIFAEKSVVRIENKFKKIVTEQAKQIALEKNNYRDLNTRLLGKVELASILKLLESNIRDEKKWNTFKEQYASLDPNFLNQLKEKHPKLSKSEIRLSILIRLKFSQKEIANILSIAPDSVKKARQRIRKKMKLVPSITLSNYLSNF